MKRLYGIHWSDRSRMYYGHFGTWPGCASGTGGPEGEVDILPAVPTHISIKSKDWRSTAPYGPYRSCLLIACLAGFIGRSVGWNPEWRRYHGKIASIGLKLQHDMTFKVISIKDLVSYRMATSVSLMGIFITWIRSLDNWDQGFQNRLPPEIPTWRWFGVTFRTTNPYLCRCIPPWEPAICWLISGWQWPGYAKAMQRIVEEGAGVICLWDMEMAESIINQLKTGAGNRH